jgi:hypothetical protein
LADITPDLARRSGFKDVADLLTLAKHGRGENIYHRPRELRAIRMTVALM